MRNIFKKTAALVLSVSLLLSALFTGAVTVNATKAVNTRTVSEVVTKGDRTYIEHNGVPYLMYGIQMRLDWQYADKIVLYPESNEADWDWIEENFKQVAEDGFKTVAIPVNWSYIETGKLNSRVYNFNYLEKMYEYIYKYDLTVQWLWFGTNVCGTGYGTSPAYILDNPNVYSRLPKIEYDIETVTDENGNVSYKVNGYSATDTLSSYMDFSDTDTMKAEQEALAAMMEYIAERDTENRCVMIQVNNEVDQGGDYWLPKATTESGATVTLDDWWSTKEKHDKYCWAFGQRDEVFAQLSTLGNIIHNSAYNCVTRVNFSDAGRVGLGNATDGYNNYTDDYDDLLALGGIDIIGVDCYDTVWDDSTIASDNIISSLTKIDGNLTHLAESSAAYDSSVNTALMLEEGIGNMIYCHRSDRTGGGLYEQASGEIKSAEAISEALVNSGAYTANGDVLNSVVSTGTKYATVTTKQNFVFDFNVKLDALMTGSDNLQLRIRSKDVSANAEAGIVGHSEGYRIHIYNNKLSLHKFNDDNWRSTEIGSVEYDFTNRVSVRLVANASKMWVELDGEKKLEINNAVSVSNSSLSFYGISSAEYTGEVSITALKYFSGAELGLSAEYDRSYKDWVEKIYTSNIRSFNDTLNKAYSQVAVAVSNADFVHFTANGETKTAGEISVTLNDNTEGEKLAMAFKAGYGEYVLMSVKNDCTMAVTADKELLSAEVGYYDDVTDEWIKTADAVVTDNIFTVNAGEVIRLIYSDIQFDSSIFNATGDTLENGAEIIEVINGGELVLSESIKNFAVEFKYKAVSVAKETGDPLNFALKMRDDGFNKYTFALNYYSAANIRATDIMFAGYGETSNRDNMAYNEWKGGDEWNSFKIVMVQQRVAIFKNGKLWYSAELKDKARAGKLYLDFSGAYETYIADLKVTEGSLADTYALIDAALDGETYGTYTVEGSSTYYRFINNMLVNYDSETGKTSIGKTNDWGTYTFAENLGKYEFETEIQQTGIEGGTRGTYITSPTGYKYLLITDCLYVYDTSSVNVGSKYYKAKLDDGNWHKVKITFDGTTEKVYYDNLEMYSVNVASYEAGAFTIKLQKSQGNIYVRNLKITDKTVELVERETLTSYPTITSSSKNVFNTGWENTVWQYNETLGGMFETTDHSQNGKIKAFSDDLSDSEFSMDMYIPSATSTWAAQFNFRGMDNGKGSSGFTITMDATQVYIKYYSTNAGAVAQAKAENTNGWYAYTNANIFGSSILDRWVELKIKMYGTNLLITLDGAVLADVNDIYYGTATTDNFIQLYKRGLGVKRVNLESLAGLNDAVTALKAVTYDELGVADETLRANALTVYNSIDNSYVREFIESLGIWEKAYYDYGDANADCYIDVRDLVRVKRLSALDSTATETAKSDVNCDGNYNANDAVIIRKEIIG